MRASIFRHLLDLWPPLLINVVRVLSLRDDYTKVKVVLRWFETAVTTASGKIIAVVPSRSMCD